MSSIFTKGTAIVTHGQQHDILLSAIEFTRFNHERKHRYRHALKDGWLRLLQPWHWSQGLGLSAQGLGIKV